MKSGDRKRKQLWALWNHQKGRCYYCDCETVLRFRENGGAAWPNEATMEHLDHRFSEDRGQRDGDFRRVMACNQCNHERGRHAEQQAGIDELRRRSKMHSEKHEKKRRSGGNDD